MREEKKLGERRTMLPRNLHCVLRLFQVRPRHHHLLTARCLGALEHSVKVILVRLLAVVHAAEDGIAQVDADLEDGSIQPYHVQKLICKASLGNQHRYISTSSIVLGHRFVRQRRWWRQR